MVERGALFLYLSRSLPSLLPPRELFRDRVYRVNIPFFYAGISRLGIHDRDKFRAYIASIRCRKTLSCVQHAYNNATRVCVSSCTREGIPALLSFSVRLSLSLGKRVRGGSARSHRPANRWLHRECVCNHSTVTDRVRAAPSLAAAGTPPVPRLPVIRTRRASERESASGRAFSPCHPLASGHHVYRQLRIASPSSAPRWWIAVETRRPGMDKITPSCSAVVLMKKRMELSDDINLIRSSFPSTNTYEFNSFATILT